MSQQEPESRAGRQEPRILIMDDEDMIRSLVVQVLSRYGYEVIAVSEGSDALEQYQSARDAGHPFNLVILDLMMPEGMNGKEVIARLRQMDPAVKAIVSSGYYDDPAMANYREYGFVNTVPKPYKVHELIHVIQETLEHADA